MGLVGSQPVGRQAPLTAALLAAVTANVAIALLACLWLHALRLPFSGAAALGMSIGACGSRSLAWPPVRPQQP